jgi:cell division protein FtsI/penicillin-binding protein 2
VIRVLFVLFVLSGYSLSADLDAALAKVMKGRSGTAVLVDVQSAKLVGAYQLNVAARRLARPGSTFKSFTLLSLLRSGKLKPTEAFSCRRNLHVGAHNLSCSHPQTGQPLQAVSALAYSCNDFFATLGSRLTANELRAAFQEAGFASATGLVQSEAVGSIQLAQTDAERQLQAIGEGEMRVTPLEMLEAYRKLAVARSQSQAADRPVFEGLKAGTDYGMARLAAVKAMKVAGKTGTARTDGGHWTNAWFAGYAPADKPRVALVVFLEKGTGPGDAAPLAAEIIEAWQQQQR